MTTENNNRNKNPRSSTNSITKTRNTDSQKTKTTNEGQAKKPRKNRKKKVKVWRIALLVCLGIFVIASLFVGKLVLDVIKDAPEIDPTNVLNTLSESSVILDQKGNIIEQIHAADENREIVSLSQMPENLKNAFIAIEDKRFEKHKGIDLRRIAGALISNLKSGNLTGQGGSTITQQLVKNLYLSDQKKLERKIKEAYLAIQMERKLTKDQILENYLNTIPLGQSTYGVQAAAYTYFSKDVSELTLAESAILAAIPKSTSKYAPYKRVSLDNLEGIPETDIVGYVYIGSIQYACVYNETAIERQRIVLSEMLNQEKISQEEYDQAINEDMRAALNPGVKKIEGIKANSFTDYVKEQVILDLMKLYNLSYEDAEQYLFKGGLIIHSTMDIDIQKAIENEYQYFGETFLGRDPLKGHPVAQDWTRFRWIGGKPYGSLDGNKNIMNDSGNVLYFNHDNILNSENKLYLSPKEYKFDDNGNLLITSNKFNITTNALDIVDCYTVDEKNQLVTHVIGGLNIATSNYEVVEKEGLKGTFKIKSDYLNKNNDFYQKIADDVLVINNKYYQYDNKGIIQPQSAAVILDYRTGHIKAIYGGRDIEGSKTFNRAVDAARQPGSTIKPIGVYISAIDHGYSPASVFDDIPMYNEAGQRWPKNWYEGFSYKYNYKGRVTMRYAIQQSLNTIPVQLFNELGAETVMNHLAKLGLVNLEDPSADTFVTAEENNVVNDINPSAMALGGLSNGFSPLAMTAAYGTIANDGVYVEPICYTKIENTKGQVVHEKVPETHVAVTKDVAFILKDMLHSSVASSNGLAGAAAIKGLGIDMAAKTGTTQDNGDFWCMGFSPYYAGGVWVGNDNAHMKLSETSTATARLLGSFMTAVHKGYEPAKFGAAPEGVVRATVCKQSGKLATELCKKDQRGNQLVTEYFISGTVPTEACDAHVSINVCKDSNMLRSEFCPEGSCEERVYVKRETPYDPDLNPNVKNANSEKLAEAIKLYKQIKIDINSGSSLEEIKGMYPGMVVLKVEGGENSKNETIINPEDIKPSSQKITIVSVHGIPVEKLKSNGIMIEDFQYQVPLDICDKHSHINKKDDVITDGNGENPDGENPDGENPDGENPDGENPGGQKPDGENPGGQKPDGSGGNGNVVPPGESLLN